MKKIRYFVAEFPECQTKKRLAFLTKQMFEEIYDALQIFPKYDDESYGIFPRWILNNMTFNNKYIFGPRIPNIIPHESIFSQEPSSPLQEIENSYLPRKKIKLDYETNEDTDRENIQPITTSRKSQDCAKFCGNPEMLNLLPGNEEIEAEISEKEGAGVYDQSEENMKLLLRNDSILIKSVSILIESKHGAEVEMCWSGVFQGNANKSGKVEGKTNSSYICPSKDMETTGNHPVSCTSFPTVDYSNPIITYFFTQRLLSIFSYRKMCMKQIHDFFKKCLDDLVSFNMNMGQLKMLVKKFPIRYFTNDLLEIHNDMINKPSDDPKKMQIDLINEAHKMSQKTELIMSGLLKDIAIWKNCLQEIDTFLKEQRKLFDVNNGTNITIGGLKRLDLRLKEICKQADGTLNSNDERKANLLNLFSDLERLSRNLVKFLIIIGILKLSPFHDSENAGEKNKKNSTSKGLRI